MMTVENPQLQEAASFKIFYDAISYIPAPHSKDMDPFPADREKQKTLFTDQFYYTSHVLFALRYQIDKLCHLLKVEGRELVEVTQYQTGGRQLIALGLYDKPSHRALPSSRTPMGTEAEALLGITFGYDEAGELIVRSGVPGTYDYGRALANMGKCRTRLTDAELQIIQEHAAHKTIRIAQEGRLTRFSRETQTPYIQQFHMAAQIFLRLVSEANELARNAGIDQPIARYALRNMPGTDKRQEAFLALFEPASFELHRAPGTLFGSTARPLAGLTFTYRHPHDDQTVAGLFKEGLPDTDLPRKKIYTFPIEATTGAWKTVTPIIKRFHGEVQKALGTTITPEKAHRHDGWRHAPFDLSSPRPTLGGSSARR